MTIPTPIQPAALPSEQGGSGSSSNIRRHWVHVAAPKNEQWNTAMDGVDKLKLTSTDLPTPRDGEVLVQIRAVSLNYRDIQVCQGAFNSYNTQARQQALVPCSDMCGVVVAYPSPSSSSSSSSSTTPRFPLGTRVLAIYLQSHLRGEPDEADLGSALGLPLPGVLARYRCFPAASLVAVPAYLSDTEASCLPLAAATAWTALNWLRPLSPSVGSTNQVKDGGGSGGASKTTIAKAAGCRALLTAATDDFAKRAKEQLQADEAINYQTHWAWEGDVLDATGGRGADVIFETGDGVRAAAGGSARTLRKSFKCVAFGGIINCIGSLTFGRSDNDDDDNSGGGGGGGDDGKTPELHRLNVNALALARNVTIKGVLNGGRDRLEEALAFYEAHGIKPVVDKTYAFAEAKEAMAYVKQGKQFGKVVITVEDGTKNAAEDVDDGEEKKKKRNE
ncbi:Zinc-type alcohol dehydrogenase-like protein [Beauveria bassiana D1-5]|uniref:Zinc-type alcohol dehydrogenase-like protein n=1 Tax=Beauveria bassiana D1-5 TaxID=1245745 RepID=A0A0A2VVB1_BEABA|nr:Zinc-type alcohol dehydrogenase-like protein [Beauveria bassiana D1-5]